MLFPSLHALLYFLRKEAGGWALSLSLFVIVGSCFWLYQLFVHRSRLFRHYTVAIFHLAASTEMVAGSLAAWRVHFLYWSVSTVCLHTQVWGGICQCQLTLWLHCTASVLHAIHEVISETYLFKNEWHWSQWNLIFFKYTWESKSFPATYLSTQKNLMAVPSAHVLRVILWIWL